MKFLKLSSFIFLLVSILWIILPHGKLPSISLPKETQHNTFGELPIVEVMDDGDFYEKDGDEEKARIRKMLEYQNLYESLYRKCLNKIDRQCGLKGSSKKTDMCRIKKADKCFEKLNRQAERSGYRLWPTTGFFYFEATEDKCPESWIECTNTYMGSFVWKPKLKEAK